MRANRKSILQFLCLLVIACLGGCSKQNSNLKHNTPAPPASPQASLGAQTLVLKLTASPRSLSPFDIRDFINGVDEDLTEFYDFSPLWEKLQIDKGADDSFEGFTPSYSRWRARTYKEISTHQGKLVVLKIDAMGGVSRRYLIFRQTYTSPALTNAWQILGNIDILDSKYEGSPHQQYYRVITMGNQVWLLLRSLGGSGTGVYQIDETWYQIAAGKPKQALEYAVEGYFSNDNVCARTFSATVNSCYPLNGNYRVEIQHKVSYGDRRGEFSKKQLAIYDWSNETGSFIFNKARSDITEEEKEDIFNTGFFSDDKFITYNFTKLKQIARRGSVGQRRWLKEALSRMESEPRKSELENLLK